MSMSRKFRTVDYEGMLNQSVSLREVLPAQHLARFIVNAVAQFDLAKFYKRYGERGGEAIAPEILLGLLLYGYASGVFSSRKIERATYESIPFRYVAGGLHPDHDTLANFRKTFLEEIKDLFVQVLVLAQIHGVLKLGNVSLDGTKIHADASKHQAVSYKRAVELETQLRKEVEELLELSEQADQHQAPPDLNVATEITFRQERIANLAEAKKVMEARAAERYKVEQAEYEAKQREREEKAKESGKKQRGKEPTAPTQEPHDGDQYNFTDPESRIMKNSNDAGFDQHYNAQVAVDQDSLLIVAHTLSNHPNDQAEAIPTFEAIPPELGKPKTGALDCGYFNPVTLAWMCANNIDPLIATGGEIHHHNWREYFALQPAPPPDDASLRAKMAYKLRTDIGRAIYGLRKSTVEPVIGIIKEVLGFRQFSLRGIAVAAGEWALVCIAFNFKRLNTLLTN